jgi:membrane fusion protein, multidrug efflux system
MTYVEDARRRWLSGGRTRKVEEAVGADNDDASSNGTTVEDRQSVGADSHTPVTVPDTNPVGPATGARLEELAGDGWLASAADDDGHEHGADVISYETEDIEESAETGAPVAAEATQGATHTAFPPATEGLVRRGFQEIGTGLADVSGGTVEQVRRFLPRRLRTLRRGRLGLVLLLAVVVVVAVMAAAAAAVATDLAGPTSVVVATSRPAVINNKPGGVGALSASPQHVSVVSLNVTGVTSPIEVTSVDVVAGQQVSAGTPLLQLNPTPFEQNKLQVAASLQQAEQTLASAVAANGTGATAGSGGAYLSVQIPTFQGEVAIDQQLLQIADGNGTSLTAPITGNISYVRVSAGQIVSPGTSLVQIIDPSTVDVSTGMQLTDLRSISPGDPVTVTPTELPGVHLYGKVLAISASAANGGLEGTVVVVVTNTTNPVPVGTQAFVTITAPVHATISVPTAAVENIELNPAVAVIRNNKVYFQPVQVGASDTNNTQIVSGLKPGQKVAITNLQLLSDGDQVKESSASP